MPKKPGRTSPGSAGAGVDSQGGPVFDPTANVLDLVEKETKRGDDLRTMEERLIAAQIQRVTAELACIREINTLRAKHDRELRKAEKGRLDSIRQVDLSTFNTTVGEIRSAVKALADITSSTATTLQARQDTTATTLAKQSADQVAEVMKRIAALELAAAQGIGKQAVVDPQMAALVEDLRKLTTSGNRREGKTEGLSLGWSILLGALGATVSISVLIGVVVAVVKSVAH